MEKEAKERQAATQLVGKGVQKNGEGTNALTIEQGKATEKAAELFGAGARYVSDAKKIKASHPEAFEQIKSGLAKP